MIKEDILIQFNKLLGILKIRNNTIEAVQFYKDYIEMYESIEEILNTNNYDEFLKKSFNLEKKILHFFKLSVALNKENISFHINFINSIKEFEDNINLKIFLIDQKIKILNKISNSIQLYLLPLMKTYK